MKISMICFTRKGYERMNALCEALKKDEYYIETEPFCKCKALRDTCNCEFADDPADEWAAKQFEKKNAILFVGAVGIAVRAIASSVNNKLTDSPVIVMDDNAKNVVPLLSGHVGGANYIAKMISELTGASAVITTSTDINNAFSIDVFAKNNGLTIKNKPGIALVSAKVLDGKSVTVAYDEKIGIDEESYRSFKEKYHESVSFVKGACSARFADVRIGWDTDEKDADLYLEPKKYTLGIGCRRGKDYESIKSFVEGKLAELNIDISEIRYITSIDVKKDEEGIKTFADRNKIPFITFSAEELNKLEGRFNDSEFVRKNVGCGNVSERSAVAGCEYDAHLILKKQAFDGMTMAVAEGKWRLYFG